jgi:N-acetylglucosaminyldiphosphoundecaprenol N-acetyl-beta-D-mannosaminyltransferase
MPMERVQLLGIPIDALTASAAIERLYSFLEGESQHHVLTPNNEMLVEASRNPEFCDVLQESSLNLPDSTGLVVCARMTGQRLPARVTGVDTVMALCAKLPDSLPVFLLGAKEGIAKKAAEHLHAQNPHLQIVGTYSGSPRDDDAREICARINASQPRLLLVAFGAPRQDLWISRYLTELPSVRVAMGVGGTFDFLAGRVCRAPKLVRVLGLEWAWRFLLEPWRAKRMWNAVVVFPWLVLRYGRNTPS